LLGAASAFRRRTSTWRVQLKWDVMLGAFAAEALVGLASLRYRLTENTAQLVSLYVKVPPRAPAGAPRTRTLGGDSRVEPAASRKGVRYSYERRRARYIASRRPRASRIS
jgi:hypothetical protein